MTRVLRTAPCTLAVVHIPTLALAQSAPAPAPPVSPIAVVASAPAAPAAAQTPAPPQPTGLPPGINWKFNFNAGWGTFGFANSLYDNPKEPGVEEDLSDQWFEGYVKPALSGDYTFSGGSQLYGKLSVVGERTYGSIPDLFGSDVSSFGPEDGYIGWRSGTALDLGENVVDFTVGRSPYQLGHGFLLWDGASEGGSRGGYWTNARKAFAFAAIARLKPERHTFEMFYLDKDELPESNSDSNLWGLNYEFGLDTTSTFGVTYMGWSADAAIKPQRNGLDVLNIRAYSAPLRRAPGLAFEFEYAAERNDEALNSNAWTLLGGYEFGSSWKPNLTYRYAFFQGDDLSTTDNEAFDPLFLGFYDWGTWWQGELAGEYFLSNSNLKSHQWRLHVSPNDKISGGVMTFWFDLDQPVETATGLTTTDDVAFEFDAYADWKLNANFTLSLVGAYADPAKAIEQTSGRTKSFSYGMAYIGYSF